MNKDAARLLSVINDSIRQFGTDGLDKPLHHVDDELIQPVTASNDVAAEVGRD